MRKLLYTTISGPKPEYLLLLFLVVALFPVAGFAQEPEAFTPPEPPPLKRMSEGEQKQLSAVNDVKKRTKLALDLMDTRLLNAEKAFTADDYREMYVNLGGFHAIMDDTLTFLEGRSQSRRSVLYNYKRLEIGLRKLAPRIQLLRRDLPVRYDPYLKALVKNVRDARDRAIEPLFGDSFAEAEGS